MKNTNRILAGLALALMTGSTGAFAAAHAGKPDAAAHHANASMPSPECHYHHWTSGQLAALQHALATQGFEPGAEACWNDAMRTAVIAFQKKAGLDPTGFPNEKTRKALGLDW